MRKMNLLGALAASAIALAATPALAEGTAAGVDVNNTATLTYSTGGAAQPQVTSNIATFKVDRKVNLTVAEVGGAATVVVGGQQNAVTTFTVTNSSNAIIDIGLAVANQTGGAAPFGGVNDNFDVTDFRFYVETDGVAGYSANDTLVTFLDEVPVDTTRTVYVLANVPTGQANGSVAAVILTGTAAAPGTVGTLGATITATTTPDDPTVVDTVLADGAGFNDAQYDGKFSSRDQYNVISAALALIKSVRVVSDPVNLTSNPKAIPGATLEYCLVVNNTGAAPATGVTINDIVPAQTTYVDGSGRVGGNATGTAPALTCDITAANGGVATGTSYTAANTTFSATIATIPAGQARTARFQVVVK